MPSRMASIRSNVSRQDEGTIGVCLGGDQERNGPVAVGEVDLDMAEIGLEALARKMPQRNEGLLFGCGGA